MEELKKGFFNVDGTDVEWPWPSEVDGASEKARVCLKEMGKSIVVEEAQRAQAITFDEVRFAVIDGLFGV